MAAKRLVRHVLLSEDFHRVEKNIFDYITSRKIEEVGDADYLESLEVIASHMLEMNINKSDGRSGTLNETKPMAMIILDKMLTNICFPLLRAPRPTTNDHEKRNKLKVIQLTYKLVSKITLGSPFEIAQHAWSLLLSSLKRFVDECRYGFGEGHHFDSSSDELDVATALDLLGSLLESMTNWDNERMKLRNLHILQDDIEECVFAAVLDVLKVVRSGSLLFKITGKILPRLLSMDEKKFLHNSKRIWEVVKGLWLQEQVQYQDPSAFFGSYAIMSSLAEIYFTSSIDFAFKVHHDSMFWKMLQTGLVNNDSLVRKQCLYLLQKAVQMCREASEIVSVNASFQVFWWNPKSSDELLKIWQQYTFLLEILEEKQLHIIQPVLARLTGLIDAAKKSNDFQFPFLHVSWLTVLIHRAAIHENRFIKKWAIMSLMSLDLQEIPLLEDSSTRDFTSGTLIFLLKEPSLYAKNDGEGKGEPSKLSKELVGFFKKCFNVLREDNKVEFVNHVLSSIHQHNISHVPLTYICQGLANLPHHPVFNEELLINIRLILSNMTSHSIVLRGAVQTFLLRVFMNLLDPSSVTLDDVLVFLGMFSKEESLCRETSLWEEVGQWLCNNVNHCKGVEKDLFSYLDEKIQGFVRYSDSMNRRVHSVRLAKFLLLCCDSSAMSSRQMNELFDIIFSTISKAQSNPYYPISNCWQAVELLRALFHELQPILASESTTDNMIVLISRLGEVLSGVMHFLLRTIEQGNEPVSFQGYRICFELLDEVKSLWETHNFPDAISQSYQALMKRIAETGLHLFCTASSKKAVTTKAWLHFVVSVKWMVWVTEFADVSNVVLGEEYRKRFYQSVRLWDLVNDLRYPSSSVEHCENNSYLNQDDWRMLAEDYIAGQWECVNKALKDPSCKLLVVDHGGSGCTLANSPVNDIVDACVEALSLVSGQGFLPCLETLNLLLPKLIAINDQSSTTRLMKSVWSVLNEIRTRYSAQFWPTLDIVVRIIFAPEILTLSAGHILTSLVSEYWKSLLTIAQDQSGLVSVTVNHLCRVFSGVCKNTPMNVCLESLHTHVDIIADICVFGPVHKKDLRLLFDTAAYIRRMGQDCGTVCLTKRKEFECEAARVRVDILALLLSVTLSDGRCTPFLEQLLRTLLERNQDLTNAKGSRFLNSENHRQKQRLWQVILVLMCRLDDTDFVPDFAASVLQTLQSDNQTSVRFFIEWVLVLLLSKHRKYSELIMKELENVSKKRLGYVASLVTIATHVFLALEDSKSRIDYLFRLLPTIIPCAFLNHSQIRAYILDALRLIHSVCTHDVWARVVEQFPIVDSCLAFADSVVEGQKEKVRLQKDRALFSLHPVNDYSIETIFETVPKIAGVIEQEIISPGDFRNEGSLPWVEVEDVPLYTKRVVQCEITDSLYTRPAWDTGPPRGDVRGTEVNGCVDEALAQLDTDFQKKITPWQVTAPPEEDRDVLDQLQRPIHRRVGDLIVVASLIDRAPNLGGLCRTCEIFGASRLVIGSKHVVSEMGFKSLSVSSEKWVDIEEVKVNELTGYISNMKQEGFTIVGVEQTARSKKLTDFQFPPSTVLLLGNEKAGIPAELIQLLDECVEIPQHGIIRSLNVHVSGALFIWEYSRQHLSDS